MPIIGAATCGCPFNLQMACDHCMPRGIAISLRSGQTLSFLEWVNASMTQMDSSFIHPFAQAGMTGNNYSKALHHFIHVGSRCDWSAFDKDYIRNRVLAPTYPWTHQRYWIADTPAPAPTRGMQETTPSTEEEHSFLRQLQSVPSDEVEETVGDFVRTHVARILRLDPTQVEDNDRLMDIGVDSLMAVELRNRLDKDLRLTESLPASLIFDHPTVQAIARYLVQTISKQNGKETGSTFTARHTSTEIMDMSLKQKEIESLSEQEAEVRLLKKLADLGE